MEYLTRDVFLEVMKQYDFSFSDYMLLNRSNKLFKDLMYHISTIEDDQYFLHKNTIYIILKVEIYSKINLD